jgi:hypothetical protein
MDTISYSLKFKVQWITVPLPLSALVHKQLIPWTKISFEVLTDMQMIHIFFIIFGTCSEMFFSGPSLMLIEFVPYSHIF